MGDTLKYLPIFVYMINHDDLILKILSNKCGYIDSNKLRKINIKYPLIKYYLENRFDYIENLNEAFNRIKYHIEIRPKCPICGGKLKYLNRKNHLYNNHCSIKCRVKDKKVKEKLEQTNIIKYGCKCILGSKEIRERIKKTNLQKYGVEYIGASKEIQEKIKKTCLNKYGVEYIGASKEIQEKIKETCLNKYGVMSPIESPEIRLKCKESYIKNFGVDNPMKSNIVKEKSKQTCLEKYGVEYSFQSLKVKEKSKQTCLEKYGVDNYSKTNEFNDKVKNTCLLKYNRNYCLNIDKSKQTCLEKYGVSSWSKTDDFKTIIKEKQKEIKIKYKQTCLEKYGVEYASQSQEIKEKIIESKRRNHTFNTSKLEEELYLYIKEKFPLVKRQYKDKIRYPYNCDFYIPELDYFIELQGYYTHNTHPYNPNSISDQVLVERYKEKYGTKCQAITIWTIKDPEKRECAKHNHLNFKEVWDLYEGKEFIDYIYNEFKNINV